ncbi:MAG: coenzyme F420-0:L-glutamate ligase, partial [Candidatus Spechtbacterales bacterium]
IDESNADGHYILWPKDPYVSAKKWYDWVRKEYGVQDVGILIVDSHSIPLRRGTVGISLSHWGFHPLIDYRGTPDLFGRPYKVSLTDIPDGLAGAAVLCMGEGSETTPLALATDLPFVTFSEKPYEATTPYSSFQIPLEEDLYYPFFKFPPWQKGGGGEGGEE